MSRLELVQNTLGQAIADAINASGFISPVGQGFMGYPTVENLTDVLHAGQYMYSVYPHEGMGAKPMGKWHPEFMQVTPVVNTLTVAASGNTLTFGGAAMPNINIHTLFDFPERLAYYRTTPADTVQTVATAVAGAINAIGLLGVNAQANGATVTVTGVTDLHCNLSGTTQVAQEVNRLSRRIQVNTWCPNPAIRDTLDEIITSNVGSLVNSRYAMGDGTSVWIRYVPAAWDDYRESSDFMYGGIYLFDCEYSVLQYSSATQIGSTQTTYTFGANQEQIIEG